ncbi:hypothetical protein OM076_39920 [Solirubrobacter ginsenosidimutans]|uniref:Uncharacterized protein n=1 Tax=Solirubrobacter ginsenosidimutans TaxID=490573 RepID=A0A9X3S554_9ACTN|nr:hypothetical protein [Solirubrobacter ginsenosidimutans]MDA0166499.1 hypothetical protein [Solirubrobacter ginsenosidimutans]
MTSSQHDTTPRRGPLEPTDERPARGTRSDGVQYDGSAGDGVGTPHWNPDEGDYS